ncbi:MAG: MFS transporter [Sphingopyxis sp.]|uniref:MFS transporter n=1 Tax=Sphingopyxis sp. TaxID=1908224 RepID=UPI001A50C02A|nr:MFS transporter [Sphingopyxis sp.]MBL9064805.1 MFS transporter [Sphingopyxis sp.]
MEAAYAGEASGWDRRAYAKLALLCFVLAWGWAARSVFTGLSLPAASDLRMNDVQLGFSQGLALSLPSALISIPLGRMIDTRNRVRLLFAISALTMVGAAATSLATSFPDLMIYRAVAGLGMMEEAVILSIAADFFPPQQRGRMIAAILFAEYAGTAFGFAFAGWTLPVPVSEMALTDGAPWRNSLFCFGIVGLLSSLPLLRLREPPRRERATRTAGRSLLANLQALNIFRALLWPLLLSQLAIISAMNMAQTWAVPIFQRRFDLAAGEASEMVAAALFVPPLLGALAGGLMADRIETGRSKTAVAMIASILMIPAALFPIMPTPLTASIFLGATGMMHSAALLVSAALGVTIIPNELRGLWIGISTAAAILVGYIVAPPLVALVHSADPGNIGQGIALSALLGACGLIAALGYWRAGRAMNRSPA